MDLLSAQKSELIRIIYQQQDKIAALEAQIIELRSRITNQNPKDKTNPPSWVKPSVKTKSRKERKKREHGFARKLDIPTKKVFHSFDRCPNCSGRLGKPVVASTRQIIDIPITPVEITEHIIYKRWCFTCKKQVKPRVILSPEVLGKQRIGIRLMSIIGVLKEVCRQPIAVIQKYLEIIHGLSLSQGELVRLLHKTADKGITSYHGILENIRGSPCLHADETGGRENGRNGYWWSFNTNQAHFMLYRKTRGKTVVEEVLGDGFEGVLSTDFYAAYNTYCGFHQRCWVHYLRDIHTLKEQYPDDKNLLRWAKQVELLYQEAKAYQGPDPLLPEGLKQAERTAKQKEFEDKLRTICLTWIKKEAPMSTLCARAISFLPEMFVFVRFEGIPSDNNAAERVLRHTVVSRKISGGTRSTKGSATKAILSSLFSTWKLQGKNPFTQCQLLLAGVSGV
jgi:hypothetical protein